MIIFVTGSQIPCYRGRSCKETDTVWPAGEMTSFLPALGAAFSKSINLLNSSKRSCTRSVFSLEGERSWSQSPKESSMTEPLHAEARKQSGQCAWRKQLAGSLWHWKWSLAETLQSRYLCLIRDLCWHLLRKDIFLGTDYVILPGCKSDLSRRRERAN